MRTSLALLLVVAVAAAADEDPTISIAFADAHAAPEGHPVGLTGDGRVLLDGARVSLAELARRLPPGDRVLLRVDERAPMRHVQWVLTVLHEAGRRRVSFAVRDRDGVEAAIPIVLPDDPEPPRTDGASLHNTAAIWFRESRHGAWGPPDARREVDLPSGMVLEHRGREVDHLGALMEEVAEHAAWELPGRGGLGELAASARTPWTLCAPVLARLRSAVDALHLFEHRVPTPQQRAADVLPWPADDERPRTLGGERGMLALSHAAWQPRATTRAEVRAAVELPSVEGLPSDVELATRPRPDDRIGIHVTGDGRIAVREQRWGPMRLVDPPGWKWCSLDELHFLLESSKRAFHLHRQKAGGSGWTDHGDGVRSSKLVIELHVDRRAPVLHVRWIHCVLAEAKFHDVRYGVRQEGLDVPALLAAPLPVDTGLDPERSWPAVRRVTVTLARPVGGSATTARIGERAPASVAALCGALPSVLAETREPDTFLAAELLAGSNVRWGDAAAVLVAMVAGGADRIETYATRIPPQELRSHRKLPGPDEDRVPRVALGYGSGFHRRLEDPGDD